METCGKVIRQRHWDAKPMMTIPMSTETEAVARFMA
jgi:hypothetical protein